MQLKVLKVPGSLDGPSTTPVWEDDPFPVAPALAELRAFRERVAAAQAVIEAAQAEARLALESVRQVREREQAARAALKAARAEARTAAQAEGRRYSAACEAVHAAKLDLVAVQRRITSPVECDPLE